MPLADHAETWVPPLPVLRALTAAATQWGLLAGRHFY